ncbi:hypothetical protein [Candidatus Uabimicrobium amorphum]|nr:hypothetical protein [Candidatus Uabimicrobium amorphum]
MDLSGIAWVSGGMGVSELAGREVEKLVSPMVADKILNANSLSDKGRVSIYRGAQAASKAAGGLAATWATYKVAKAMKVKEQNVKAVKMGGLGASILNALKCILEIKNAFGENAQSSAALLVEERKRLAISAPASTGAYLTVNRTGAYLTNKSQINQTGAYMTADEKPVKIM